MSQENVELVRRSYEVVQSIGPLTSSSSIPRSSWRGPREFPDLAEAHFGYDGVQRSLEKLFEAIED